MSTSPQRSDPSVSASHANHQHCHYANNTALHANEKQGVSELCSFSGTNLMECLSECCFRALWTSRYGSS